MIKKILLLLIIIFSFQISAQEKMDSIILSEQKKYFEIGEKALKKRKSLKALNAFHTVSYLKDIDSVPTNMYEIQARKKVDSLLPIFQKLEIKKLKGKWKLKQLTTEKHNYEFIEITDTEILFFDKNSNTPIRIEKIEFAPYDDTELILPFLQLIFKNNEIWEFNIRKVKKETRLLTYLARDENGVSYNLVDDRGIIKDPKARKKAYEGEIKTYYTLE
ncbi:hypothetical protein [Flavobacterium lacisediminis]|uniref:GLPGLI family protein n=1 Tax=Flavobacterium lacisediminis TaxID=2989705 RepID=A0ABT3EGF2_9FLAO|nr:hypothetical protein [Flavobacterium lacisediminis]MCW1147649.1 hypothetical protein [Flavobacterium lacisediminis]